MVPRHRREGAPLHHQHRLEQGAGERRGFHMPDIALDAGHSQRRRALGAAERLADCVALDAVADHGAGGVCLHVVEFLRRTPGTGGRLPHQRHLSMAGGGGDVAPLRQADAAVGGAGRVHGGRLHYRVDRIAVALGRRQRLDREHERPFRTQVAVGVGVEGVALALGTDHAQGVEAGALTGRPQVVCRPDEGLLAVPRPQRVQRLVQRGQTGGTGRAARQRRAHQVEVVGDAVGQHRQADAGDGELVGAERRPPVGGGRHLGADEHSRGTVSQRVQIPAGAFARLPGTGQEHAHVRVGGEHLVVRHAEQAAVEPLFAVVADQPLVRAREPSRPGELPDRPEAALVAVDDRLPHDLALAEQPPEVVVRNDAAGQAMAVPDDRDRFVGARRVHVAVVAPIRNANP